MIKTDKSTFTKVLEQEGTSNEPSSVDIKVYDGIFLLHTLKHLPSTFGNIALKFLKIICSENISEIYVVFDQYLTLSIKSAERDSRNEFSLEYTISGPEQSRPTNFQMELRNDKFKIALINFFIDQCASPGSAQVIGKKIN